MDTSAPIAGRWNYSDSRTPHQYGEVESYQLAADWLNSCAEVEDRGCGCAFARSFIKTRYFGVDGSPSPWTDMVADLMTYRCLVPGILLRHVLEHNIKWPVILQNALEDFTKRMVIVLHIPPAPMDEYLAPAVFPGGIEVPNIRLCKADLMRPIAPFLVKMGPIASGEILYYLEK